MRKLNVKRFLLLPVFIIVIIITNWAIFQENINRKNSVEPFSFFYALFLQGNYLLISIWGVVILKTVGLLKKLKMSFVLLVIYISLILTIQVNILNYSNFNFINLLLYTLIEIILIIYLYIRLKINKQKKQLCYWLYLLACLSIIIYLFVNNRHNNIVNNCMITQNKNQIINCIEIWDKPINYKQYNLKEPSLAKILKNNKLLKEELLEKNNAILVIKNNEIIMFQKDSLVPIPDEYKPYIID